MKSIKSIVLLNTFSVFFRFNLVKNAGKRVSLDGLNTLEYTVLKTELQTLYTWILVTCDEKKIMADQTANRTDMNFNPVS